VAALAKRYRVTAAQIAQWNRIDDSTRFKKAQALVIWQPAKAESKSKARSVAVASVARGGAVKGTKIRPTHLARK
jgi:membrane-bound lytic murein transglycosylase D